MRMPHVKHVSGGACAPGAGNWVFALGAAGGLSIVAGLMVCTGVEGAAGGGGVDCEGTGAWDPDLGTVGAVAIGATAAVCPVGAKDEEGGTTCRVAVGVADVSADREAPHREHSNKSRGIAMPQALQCPVSTWPRFGPST